MAGERDTVFVTSAEAEYLLLLERGCRESLRSSISRAD